MSETRTYAVNDRPVKIAALPGGGIGAFVYEFATGTLVRDDSYLARVLEHGKDIDSLSAAAFAAALARLRQELDARPKFWDRPIVWEHTGDGEHPYRAQIDGSALVVRVNDFPAEPLYTLIVDGAETADLEDWPAPWTKPPPATGRRSLPQRHRGTERSST